MVWATKLHSLQSSGAAISTRFPCWSCVISWFYMRISTQYWVSTGFSRLSAKISSSCLINALSPFQPYSSISLSSPPVNILITSNDFEIVLKFMNSPHIWASPLNDNRQFMEWWHYRFPSMMAGNTSIDIRGSFQDIEYRSIYTFHIKNKNFRTATFITTLSDKQIWISRRRNERI